MKRALLIIGLIVLCFGCDSEPSQEERDKIEAEVRRKIELENQIKEEEEKKRRIEAEREEKIRNQNRISETIKFIQSKTSVYNEGYWGTKNNVKYRTDKDIEINGCQLKYKIVTKDEKGHHRYDWYEVDIKDLNPNHVEIDDNGYGHYITLNVTAGRKLVKETHNNGYGHTWYENESEISDINCLDNDRAKRVVRAFNVLINHCGGKDEMY